METKTKRVVTTATKNVIVYVAFDGAEFNTERECRQYEDARIHNGYDSLKHCNFCSPTDPDYSYEMALLESEADFNTLVVHWEIEGMETDYLNAPSAYPCVYTVYVENSGIYDFDTKQAIKDLYDTAHAMEDFVKSVFKGESNENQ